VAVGGALALALVLALAQCRTFEVRGGSMAPTLREGETILAERLLVGLFGVGRFDVVVCADPTDPRRECVKRIVGLPGETIEIRSGGLFVDGRRLDEPFLGPAGRDGAGGEFGPVCVPDGAYFALGDNRRRSVDSRVWAIQSPPVWLTAGDIRGRVVGRLFASGERREREP